MSARAMTWRRLLVRDEAAFNARLSRATGAGALGGALGFALAALAQSGDAARLALFFATAAVLLALPKASVWLRLALGGTALFVAAVEGWGRSYLPLLFAGATGLLLMLEFDTWPRRLVAFGGAFAGGAWALVVTGALSLRFLGVGTVTGLLGALAAGLFVGLGALLAEVHVTADSVEPRLAAAPKVAQAWVRLRRALGRLPGGAPRERLTGLALGCVARWEALQVERDGVAASLSGADEAETRAALSAIDATLETASDELLRRELLQVRRVHHDTLEQLDGLRRRLERLEAATTAEGAWLDTAAFSAEVTPPTASHVEDLLARLTSLSPARQLAA